MTLGLRPRSFKEVRMNEFEELLKDYLSDPKNNFMAEDLGPVKAIQSYKKEPNCGEDRWIVRFEHANGGLGYEQSLVSAEELKGWMWAQIKLGKFNKA